MFDTGLDETGLGEAITLTALEFDVLWEHLDLGDMPLILKVPSPGRTNTERALLVERVWESLEARGLGRSVSLSPELVTLLRLIARPLRELDGRLWVGRSVRLLAAATDDAGVLATQEGDTLTLRSADGLGLPRHALSVLPPATAGPGHSVTLPSKDFEGAARDATAPKDFEASLRRRGLRDVDADALRTMIGDVLRQGQFGGAARDKWGRRIRTPRVISFFDTEAGRYLQVRRTEANGEAWTTISPADHRRLLHHLTELHAEGATH
ncbi:ESX secretion-associated protein EspG [Actinocrispum wychmicini]|uniref:ESAT-6 protein secretion system EspG family protein n=1 Tax=Actinocrispum wychmicini TaxID=1213861 RepID=A0A4R2K6Y1_9PSEU|nr:ESX secretion-associated protein EspG [Actinocrispum wychmicini]TCO65588.1 ESAT-6 protein secretion system EspG family protein [Actinocrispum wychmicini]